MIYADYGYMGMHGYQNFMRDLRKNCLNNDELAKVDKWKMFEFIKDLLRHGESRICANINESPSNCRKFADDLLKIANVMEVKLNK